MILKRIKDLELQIKLQDQSIKNLQKLLLETLNELEKYVDSQRKINLASAELAIEVDGKLSTLTNYCQVSDVSLSAFGMNLQALNIVVDAHEERLDSRERCLIGDN